MKYNKSWIMLSIFLLAFVSLLSIKAILGVRDHNIYDSSMEDNISQRDMIKLEPNQENQPENSALQSNLPEVENNQENHSSENTEGERVEPFVDEELYLYIKDVYGEIDYDIQFLRGNESKYDLYKDQFLKLLEEEIPIVDEETGREIYISSFGELSETYGDSVYKPDNFNYYFYDVDGDGTPELGVTDNQRYIYIFKYEEEAGKVVMWDVYFLDMSLMGTGKFCWSGPRSDYAMLGLDQNGDYIFLARFKVEGNSKYDDDGDDGWAFFVALPDYVELEEWMLEQATYKDAIYANYFFRLTKKQYDELEGRLLEALHESYKEKEEITYTYEELLHLK